MSTNKDLVIVTLERIEQKVDKLDNRLDDMEKIQIKQEINLQHHMRRSELLENSQNKLEKAVEPLLKTFIIITGICKLVVGLGIVAALFASIVKIIG